MPTQPQDHKKKHKRHPQAEVSGRVFTWHPLDENDEIGNLADVTMKLRIKVNVLREVAGLDYSDANDAIKILETLVPDQRAAVDEMDMYDLLAMLGSFMEEYSLVSGASLGESSGSSS